MKNMDMQSRRDFLRNAVMLAGAGVTAPLWAAMKYKKDAAMRYFREQASETDARVKAGIEANRKGDATFVICDLFGREWRTNLERDAPGGWLSFRGFCGTYEVEAISNGRTVRRQFHVGRENSDPIKITMT